MKVSTSVAEGHQYIPSMICNICFNTSTYVGSSCKGTQIEIEYWEDVDAFVNYKGLCYAEDRRCNCFYNQHHNDILPRKQDEPVDMIINHMS